jgi:hypothetical protein
MGADRAAGRGIGMAVTLAQLEIVAIGDGRGTQRPRASQLIAAPSSAKATASSNRALTPSGGVAAGSSMSIRAAITQLSSKAPRMASSRG